MKPVHPLVVHFPIALLALSVTADLLAFFARIESLRSTGWWALMGAAVGGVLTVLAGLFDMQRANLKEDVHVRVHRHMKVGFALLASIGGLTLWRWTFFKQPRASPSANYLDCGLFAMALAAFQGWLGGVPVSSDWGFVQSAGAPPAVKGGE